MEPPAVTSCSQQQLAGGNNSSNLEKLRRTLVTDRASSQTMHPQHFRLQIEPSLTYTASSNRVYEELPENFMESISPQQNQGTMQQNSPQLASLAPMNVTANDSGYMTLVPMSSSQNYGSSMKVEPLHDQTHHQTILHRGARCIDKLGFSSGPADLLSPLHSNRSDNTICETMIGIHQNGGRTDAIELRRPVQYIKEEVVVDMTQEYKNVDANFLTHQMQQSTSIMTPDERQQELEHRLANAETPPAVSNVELASSFIATMIGEQRHSPVSQQTVYRPGPTTFHHQATRDMNNVDDVDASGSAGTSADLSGSIDGTAENSSRHKSAAGLPRATYSTKDTTDPLNAEIDDNIYIDTKDLCRRIAWELKQHSIPQAIFAERILCRSQGTLSDLLRNPKPWNKLKSGRETFRRMFNWVQQPLESRLGILDMYKGSGDENYIGSTSIQNPLGGKQVNLPSSSSIPPMSPPTPAQNARQGARHRSRDIENGAHHGGSGAKRPRLVFTDIQKRTLQAIFKETQRPSREMQQTIAEHLRLDLSTVANFFMNARRRSRSGPLMGDSPAPYQQVRPITPPPASPPHQQRGQSRIRGARHIIRGQVEVNLSITTSNRIENTVAQVAEEAAEYARKRDINPNVENEDDQNGMRAEIDNISHSLEYKVVNLSPSCSIVVDSRQSPNNNNTQKTVEPPCNTPLDNESFYNDEQTSTPVVFYDKSVKIEHENSAAAATVAATTSE
ncbi:unnamed protein product [Dracunculus medinensis]|uniref:One cut domain family member n=1 Tax=Dracunculus medinensis TaxID=318479 RepID=A0A0N4U2L1_DRAME|nr:unnamed protein product [Dracunculus medinensis]